METLFRGKRDEGELRERERERRERERERERRETEEKGIYEQNDTMIGRAVYREPLPYSHERLFPVAARPIVCIRSKFYYS